MARNHQVSNLSTFSDRFSQPYEDLANIQLHFLAATLLKQCFSSADCQCMDALCAAFFLDTVDNQALDQQFLDDKTAR